MNNDVIRFEHLAATESAQLGGTHAHHRRPQARPISFWRVVAVHS